MGVKGGGEGEIRQGGETGRGEETCIIYDNLPDNDCYPKDITLELTGSVGSEYHVAAPQQPQHKALHVLF